MMEYKKFQYLTTAMAIFLAINSCLAKKGVRVDRQGWTAKTRGFSVKLQDIGSWVPSDCTDSLDTTKLSSSTFSGAVDRVMMVECSNTYSIGATIDVGTKWKRVTLLDNCEPGSFNFGDKVCSANETTCFHDTHKTCITPRTVMLHGGTCTETDWKVNLPNYCSIGKTMEGCQEVGRVERVPWVVDSKGVKHLVEKLNIELSQETSDSDSWLEDELLPIDGKTIYGNEKFCTSLHPTEPRCHKVMSTSCGSYRIYNDAIDRAYYHTGSCSEPVYCYGYSDVVVYDKANKKGFGGCTDCKAICDKTQVTITTNEAGYKMVKVCGRHACTIEEFNTKIMTVGRDFYSKISDERVTIDITDKDKYHSILYTDCTITPVCEAIDCNFCMLRLVNYTCYMWYHWVIVFTLMYVVLVLFGLLLITVKPIFHVIVVSIRLAYLLCRKIIVLVMSCISGRAKRVKHFAEDDQELGRSRQIYTPTTVRGIRPTKITPLMYVVAIFFLLASALARAPCSNTESYIMDTKTCTQVGEKFHCKMETAIDIPITSYDQTSCLHVLNEQHESIAQLQITPSDLSFACGKVTEYYTRDVVYHSDHVVRCPHAGPCSEEWCNQVNDDTRVDGLAEITWPHKQFCKLGGACWGNGCFFCSSSCHVVRWYAKPLDSIIYEVFSCPRWDPSGTFHFLYISNSGEQETNMMLLHGETRDVRLGIKANLKMEVQTKLPVLSKKFLSGGGRAAMIDASPKGQPQPGTIGAMQCNTKTRAGDLKCFLAPNNCICEPNESSDSCDCAQISLDGAFTQSTSLPLVIGNDHIEMTRDMPILKTAAYGSATIRITTNLNMIMEAPQHQECSILFKELAGCHSCILGANVSYSCIASRTSTVILDCDGKIKIPIDCSGSGESRSVRAFFPSPLVDIACRTACSKDPVRIYGHLNSIGLRPINNGSHIQLAPTESLEGLGTWLSSIWRVIGWWYLAMVVIFFIVIAMVLFIMGKRTTDMLFKKSN